MKNITENTVFIQNEYYKKYKNIIFNNAQTQYEKHNSNRHHIIPRVVFNINNLPIDNSASNIVILSITDHIMVHYYLALCVKAKYRVAMENAFFHLINSHNEIPTEIEIVKSLPEYQKIYEQYCKDLSTRFSHEEKSAAAKLGWKNRVLRGSFLNNKPTSQKQKLIASKTFKGKPKSKEQKEKMSKSGKAYHRQHPDAHVGKNNPMYGRKRMHLISDPTIQLIVKPAEFQKYLQNGYAFNDKNFVMKDFSK